MDGFNLSRIGDGASDRCPSGPSFSQRVLFDFSLGEGLVSGDFERVGLSGQEAGWSTFHGGLLTGDVIYDGVDSNWYLDLSRGQIAIHSRFLVPDNARGIQICRSIIRTGDLARIELKLYEPKIPLRSIYAEVLTAIDNWQCFVAPVARRERGKMACLAVLLSDDGSPSVQVDDFLPPHSQPAINLPVRVCGVCQISVMKATLRKRQTCQKAGTQSHRVLASSATILATKDPKIAGLPKGKPRGGSHAT